MSWKEVNLNEVKPTFSNLPEGDYVLEIRGAREREYQGFTDISVMVAVVSPEEFAGRTLFMDYPDPEKPKCQWSPGALKRLYEAIGITAVEGADKVEELNQAIGLHFQAPVGLDRFTNANGEAVERNKVLTFKARPAA